MMPAYGLGISRDMDMEGGPAQGATRLGRDSYQAAELPGTAETEAPGQLHATASPGPDKGCYCQLLAAAG